LKQEIQKDMLRLAVENKLSSLEKPKQLVLYHELPETCITPTFKLKRNVASEFFKEQIDEMYAKIAEAEAA